METIWQGTDSLNLVSNMRKYGIRNIYYAFKYKVFAKFVDKFTTKHYCCGELVERNLRKFGVKKSIEQFYRTVDKTKLVKTIPHDGVNILYYYPKKSSKLRKWLYGYDIFLALREQFHNRANFIVVDGTFDMADIYPTIDLLIRPNRHDGRPRMVEECKANGIPVLSTLENPKLSVFIEFIKNFLDEQNKKSS